MAVTDQKKLSVLHLSRSSEGGIYRYAVALNTELNLASELSVQSAMLTRQEAEIQELGVRQIFTSIGNRAISSGYHRIVKAPFHRSDRFHGSLPEELHRAIAACDILHLHQISDWVGISQIMSLVSDGQAVVVTLHDMWWTSGGCIVFDGCNRFKKSCRPCPILASGASYFLASKNLASKKVAFARRRIAFVANSKWTASVVAESVVLANRDALRIVPPSIDIGAFRPSDQGIVRKLLGIHSQAFVVSVGAASVTDLNKNIKTALAILSKVRSRTDLVVLVFGEGKVEAPIKLDCRFFGGIETPVELANIFVASDVYVSTSLMESYGMTIVEAMACGVPIVAYKTGAIPEAAPDGIVGLLAPLHDELAFQDCVQKLSDDPSLRVKLGEQGSRLARERNSASEMAQSYAAIYSEVLVE